MYKFIFCLGILLSTQIFAQPVTTSKSILIKPVFTLGQTLHYVVKAESKEEDPPKVYSRSQQEYKASFTILDTTNGYRILYRSQTINVSDRSNMAETLYGNISNNISLIYNMDKEGRVVSYEDMNGVKVKLINSLDSMERDSDKPVLYKNATEWIRTQLYSVDGMEKCLKPLTLFNSIFGMPVFRTPADYTPGFRMNMYNETRLPGVMVTSLKKQNTKNNTALVEVNFIGHKDSAAKYFTPIFREAYSQVAGKNYKGYVPTELKNNIDREYEVQISTGIPNEISERRMEYYFYKTVFKVSMKRVEE